METGKKESILKIISVLDKAIEIEHNAAMFYSKMSMSAKNEKLKERFKFMRELERGHHDELLEKRRYFAAHPEVKGFVPPLKYDSNLSETSDNIDISEFKSEEDIIRKAISNEKKAYMFYQRKLTFADDPSLKTLYQELASEEEQHVNILKELLREMM